MTWVLLTEQDVLQALNATEVATYREHRAEGQPDPLPGILAATTDEVRAYVARQTRLTGAGIPAALAAPAADIAIWRLAKRLQLNSEQQRWEAAAHAYTRLDLVARGEIALETDTLPDPPPDPPPAWGGNSPIGLRA